MVDVETSALLDPPGMGNVQLLALGAVAQFALSVACVGKLPECCPVRKIIGDTGSNVTEEAEPPHSCPQLST